MKLEGEKHPLFQSLIKDDFHTFEKLISRGLDPFKERMDGVSAYLLAHYLRRPKALKLISHLKKEHFHLDGWNDLRTPANDRVTFLAHPFFDSFRLFKQVWSYSQEVKNQLEFKSLWFSKLFKRSPSVCTKPPSVYIRHSSSDVGMGLFAADEIPEGSILGEYTGIITKWNFWKYRPGDYRFQYPKRKKIKSKYVIDAEKGGNWTRLVNHSYDPNVEAVAIFSGGILRMLYVIYKTVQKGEELKIDYGTDYWKMKDAPENI